MNPLPFSSRIVTVSSYAMDNQNSSHQRNVSSISTGSNSSTDLNHDQIFAPNAWWRSFGNTYSNTSATVMNASTITPQENQYANLMPSGNVLQELNSDSCSVIDWESFFTPSSHFDEPKITSIPSTQQQQVSSCKITINPNCTSSSFDNSTNFTCHNNYSMTTTPNTTAPNNAENTSNIDGMINLLNRILIMNGVNPASQCQMPIPVTQQPNLETNPATFVTEQANYNYSPIQSFQQFPQPSNFMNCNIQSQSIQNSSTLSISSNSSSSSDSDSTNSHHSNNSNKNKIAKKRTTRPRLKFQKETDKSIKFNLVTSEELAASLQFHETLVPSSGKRNRGRPKKSQSSPQKPKPEQSIEFMVNCYDQCSKIFR